jgi:hypothetical protein
MNPNGLLVELIKKIDDILSLSSEGLLKSEEMYEVIYEVEDELKKISKELDKRSQLSIEKNIPKWRNYPKSGIFVQNNEVQKRVTPLRALLSELMDKYNPQPLTNLKSEIVINAGKPYEGRLYLRTIFDQAIETIFIRDSYLRPNILDTILEYFLDNNSLKVQIIVGDNNRLPSFKVSYLAFIKQYPSIKIEARYSSKTQLKDHPRYIFIDDKLLFNPDHSLDQWGEKTVNIHQMTEISQINKVRSNLLNEWNGADKI